MRRCVRLVNPGRIAIGLRRRSRSAGLRAAGTAGDAKMKMLTGQCRCRAVSYEVADAFAYALYCHCSNCRRATGSAFKPLAGIHIEDIRISDGADQIMTVGDPLQPYVHCAKCGSLLYAVVRDGAYAHVTMGTLVDTPSIRPTHHIFVGSKAPWYEITDTLPQYDGFADG
jgi:hypothetical protein